MANSLPDLVQGLIFQVEGLAEAGSAFDKTLSKIGKGTDAVQKGLAPFGKAASSVFKSFSSGLGDVVKDVVGFGVKVGGIAGAGLIAFGEKSIQAAARVQEMDVVLQNLAKTSGISKQTIDKQVAGVRDMGIEYAEAQDTISGFIQTNMDVTKASALARVAQDAAVLSTSNSTETLQRLMWGIQTGQTEVLRTAGLTIDMQGAYDKYAKSIGKTSKQLTGQQKQQAALNAVLEAGTAISGTYAAAMESPGKQLRSLPRYMNDVQVAVGQAFLPAFGQAIGIATDFLKGMKDLVGEGTPLNKVLVSIGKAATDKLILIRGALRGVFDTLKGSAGAQLFQKVGDTVGKLSDEFGGLAKILAPFGAMFASSFLGSLPIIGQFIPTLSPVTAALAAIVISSKDLRDELVHLGHALFAVGTGNIKTITDGLSGLAKLIGDTLAGVLKDITPALTTFIRLFTGRLPGLISLVGDAIAEIGPAVGKILSSGLKVVTGLFDTLTVNSGALLKKMAPLVPVVVALAEGFGFWPSLLVGAVVASQDLRDAIGDLGNVLLKDLKPAIGPIVTALSGLEKAIGDTLGGVLKTVTPALDAFFKLFVTNLPDLIGAVAVGIGLIGPAIGDIISAGLEVVTRLFGTLSGVMVTLIPLVADAAGAFGEMIAAVIRNLGPPLDRIISVLGTMASAVLPTFTSALKGLTPIVAFLGGTVFSVLASILERVAQVVVPLGPMIGVLAAAFVSLQVIQTVQGYADKFLGFLTNSGGPIDGMIGKVADLAQQISEGGISGGLTGALKGGASALVGMIGPQVAVTAVTALATYAIMKYVKQKEEQRQRVKDVSDALKDETRSVQDSLTAYAQKQILSKHEEDDLIRLGISYKTYGEAVAGSTDAQNQIRAAMVATGEVVLTTTTGMARGQQQSVDATEAQTKAWIEGKQPVDEYGNAIELMTGSSNDLLGNMDKNTAAIAKQAETALTAAKNTGELSDAQYEAYQRILQGKDGAIDYTDVLKGLSDAHIKATDHTKEEAAATEHVKDTYDDASGAANTYNDVLDKLLGRNIDAEQSGLRLQKSFEDLGGTTGEASLKLAGFGQITTDGKLKLSDMTQEILRNAESQIKNGDSLDVVKQKTADYREQLLNAWTQMGGNRAQAEAYINTLDLTPAGIETLFKQVGIEQALPRVQEWIDQIKNVPEDKMTAIKAAMEKKDLGKVQAILKELGLTIPTEVLMGVDAKKPEAAAKALQDKVIDPTVNPKPDTKKAEAAAKKIQDKKIEPTVEPVPNTKKTDAALNKMDDPRKVDVTAQLQGVSSYNSQLAAMTKDRTVTIRPVVTPTPGIPGQADGGPVQANKMYMIGERGPELFVSSEAGFIHPAESPFTKLAAKVGALQFVDPMQKTNLRGQTVMTGAGSTTSSNLAIGSMTINHDLDLDVAMTRIGMAMSGAQL